MKGSIGGGAALIFGGFFLAYYINFAGGFGPGYPAPIVLIVSLVGLGLIGAGIVMEIFMVVNIFRQPHSFFAKLAYVSLILSLLAAIISLLGMFFVSDFFSNVAWIKFIQIWFGASAVAAIVAKALDKKGRI